MNSEIAQATAIDPNIIPPVEHIPIGSIGFVAIAFLWTLQYIIKANDRQSGANLTMLQQLLQSQQKTAETLAKTNAELVARMARIHERLERLERVLLQPPDRPK